MNLSNLSPTALVHALVSYAMRYEAGRVDHEHVAALESETLARLTTPTNAVMLCKDSGAPVRVFTSWDAGLAYVAGVYSEYVSGGVTDMRDANIATQRLQHWVFFGKDNKVSTLCLSEMRPDAELERYYLNSKVTP